MSKDALVTLFKAVTTVGILSVIILRPAAFVKILNGFTRIVADAMKLGGSK